MFFDPYKPLEITRGSLPHWRQEGVMYFVTFRLADSVPHNRVTQWMSERDAWLKHHPEPWSEDVAREFHENFTERLEYWLDQGSGDCLLAKLELSEVVADALKHFEGDRYQLESWVIMPNHVHVLCQPNEGHRLSNILHSWKSFTAKAINQQLGREGRLWQKDFYNQIVRSEEHHSRLKEYIKNNPNKANVEVHHASWIKPSLIT